MKNYFIIITIIYMILLIIGCNNNGTDPNPEPYTTGLSGEYLGQQPPGLTPVRFTPEVLLSDGSWWWISPPKFSPNGREIVFTKYILGNPYTKQLYSMQRLENDNWTLPDTVSFSSNYNDCHAAFSIDGSKLFFISRRPDGPLFFVNKITNGWSVPVPLNIPNSTSFGNQFSISREETIYFELSNGQADDIYRSRLANGVYSDPENLGVIINTDNYEEYAPFIDPDEEYLIFASNRPGGFGGNDLYISFKNPDGSWTQPQNMGSTINSEFGDTIPYVSPDGNYFFFITARAGDPGYNPYWVSSQIIEDLKPDSLQNINVVIDFDGNVYQTIEIGNQCWMVENLKTIHAADGTLLNGVYSYNDDENNVEEYGRLYTWESANNASPAGWHLPSNTEWNELLSTLGSNNANKLKEGGSSGFEVKMAGQLSQGSYGNLESLAAFWTSTESGDGIHAMRKLIIVNESNVITDNDLMNNGFSVRCIKD